MSEPYIVIDEKRDINVPEELRGRIVQFDHNVETFTFQCPRYWDGRDLSTMEIFVNYVIDPKKGTCSAYLVKELNVNEADDNMTFDWVVTQDATTKEGELIIFVCAQLTDELGNLQHHWSSNFNKDFKLAKSYKCLQGIVDNYPNIIGQMLADIDKLKENGGSATFTYNEATGDVTFGNETVLAAPEGIEAHTEIVSINGRGLQDAVARGKISELSEEIADLKENGTGGGETVAVSNIIDLERYGIVQADYTEPFTVEMYEVAYQNGVGIQNAINDAKANGMTEIILPSGNYPVCYSSDEDATYNTIIDSQNINFIGYGAKLYVIYDEEGVNPYFTGETPRLLQGTIIKTNSDVRGFHLVGERAFRKDENTKYREFSGGISLTETTNGNLIKDCICELFSGDGIGSGKYMEQIAGWDDDTNGLFTSVDWDPTSNSWVESKTRFTSISHGGDWIDKTRPILLRCSSYFLYTTAPLRILCFDENDNYIGDVRFWQGEYFYFLPNTAKWYLQITREIEHETTATEVWGYWIGYGFYNDTTIDNCEIRFNQRGGISNVPSGSTIKNCSIHHNGCAYGDMVAFYDSTQFGIDIEDIYIHDITIEGCQIVNNLQGVLYRCWGIRFKNCSIYGYVNSLNSCVDFYAENTRFNWSCTMNSPTPHGTKVAIGCIFNGAKADEILDVASGVVKSTKVNSDGIVNFLNANGEVVFNMDLTTLIYIAPELVSEGLEVGCDFTTLETGATTFDLQYGNATATARTGMIVEGGCVPVGNGNYITVTDNESDYSSNEFTIEMFCLGFPYHAMRSISGNFDLIETDSVGSGLVTVEDYNLSMGYSIPYNGGRIKNTNVFLKLYVDGVETTGNRLKIPSLDIDKYIHIVITGNSNGEVFAYLNGYKSTKIGTATNSDFETWSTSDFTNFYLYGGPASETQILKHFNIYNRALSEDEIKKNLNYFKKTFGYDS